MAKRKVNVKGAEIVVFSKKKGGGLYLSNRHSKVQRFGKDKLHYPKLDEKPKHN